MMNKYRLMSPGPTPIPPEVSAAGALPIIHHRTPEFGEVFTRVNENLQRVFLTENEIFTFAASGTGAFEGAIQNLFSPGDKVLVVNNGNFGGRWVKMARAFGLEVTELKYEWGEKADNGELSVNRPNDERRAKELHGLSRTLVANMIVGVTEGYKKTLEINGTGYRVTAKGKDLEFALGFSHPVNVIPPAGITFSVVRPTQFTVAGIDKQLVGEVAANIRKIRPPEPYKGKGVKYQGEVIRRKAGKAGKK